MFCFICPFMDRSYKKIAQVHNKNDLATFRKIEWDNFLRQYI